MSGWKPFLAYVLPFVLFAVLTTVESMESLAAWYPWLYAAKVLAIGAALVWGMRYHPPITSQGLGWGLLYGLVGGILWIVLCTWNLEKDVLPPLFDKLGDALNLPSIKEWLKPGSRLGYEPFAKLSMLQAYLFVGIRLIGLVLLVPLLEELFWRGFLNRIIVDENWQSVPWGRMTAMSFVILTAAFVLVHTEWTAALVWVVGMHWLYVKTKSLWACVVAHAASNAVLGYYILAYGQWQLW
ncbi:MAG TPA: CAAX prenyl protease-related protein [Gemmatales bacterium]|nr:CAAX prenyl protease-related protein [Gemmatales bacterium]